MSQMLSRRMLRTEVALVLLLSLGASGIWALLRIINLLTNHVSLASQTATIISSVTPDRPWLDLAYQLVGISLALVPVALVAHLLQRSGEGLGDIGFDRRDVGRDVRRGVVVAAVVGGSGLGLYLVAWKLGGNVHLVASALGPVWWAIPVLILAAIENALLEETVVLGYLLHRLDQLGIKPKIALVGSALLRGSYHLYQGLGGFFGNFAMGLIFGAAYRKWGRVMPLVIAHSIMDAVAFVGYQVLHGRVSWLP
ncbi:MAG: type II CAAX endopeptidase family protein [Actinomycetes bacterium]